LATKTKQWRMNRLRIKREKNRLRKLVKPNRDRGWSGHEMTHDKPGFNIFSWLSRPLRKKETRIDRREPNGRQGDR